MRILDAISQLVEFMPVQYVTGMTWFCGFKFKVRPGVLIPRPETEEMVMKIARKFDKTEGLSVLDIGTGSGAIAISLSKLLPGASVSAIDISKDALRISEENAFLNESTLTLIESDILNRNKWNRLGKFNLIVSNPPYVKQSERSLMRRNVLDYEPETALFVDDSNSLVFYNAIAEFAATHLEPGGELWFEINETGGKNIFDLLNELGFSGIQIHPDFNSKPRFVSACKPVNI